MKKVLNLLLAIVLLVTTAAFSGCDEKPVPSESLSPEQTPIACDIKFAKTVDEKYRALELYEGDEFEINTKIYVIVDFTFINYGEEDGFVEFKVQIPYAKYYSTHEYEKGVIEPNQEEIPFLIDGRHEPGIQLSNMVFLVKAGQTPFHYEYCFAIAANQVCENVEFKAVFVSDDGIVIPRNQTFTKTYSFVQTAEGGEQ